mgnify:CR=1 FL=1
MSSFRTRASEEVFCSFCGRHSREVESIIAGPNVYICDFCVTSSAELLRKNHLSSRLRNRETRLSLTPLKIKSALDEYVIGQEQAKKILAVAVYNHYKRVNYQPISALDDVEVEKSNKIGRAHV